MARFLDLDAVVVPDLDVQLGGETYRVPGSPDVPRMLRWISYQERFGEASAEGAVELLQEIYDDLVDLFRIYQPDIESLPIRQEQIMPLFEKLFEGMSDDDADPPTPAKAPRKRRN